MKLNWKTACTCLGCIIGAVCITVATGGAAAAPSIGAVITAIGAGGAGGFLVGNKIDTEEKKVKNHAKELEIKGQTIESIRKDSEQLVKEKTSLAEQISQKEKNANQKEQEIKSTEAKLKDPNIPEDEKKKLRQKLSVLQANLADEKKEIRELKDKHKKTEEQIKNNNKTISTVGSGSYGKDKGVWEFITLENILIAFAIYALWQIIKEDKR